MALVVLPRLLVPTQGLAYATQAPRDRSLAPIRQDDRLRRLGRPEVAPSGRVVEAERLLSLRSLEEVLAQIHAERAVDFFRFPVGRPSTFLKALGNGGVVVVTEWF